MRGVMPLPLWAVALVLAALAPFLARALASRWERRSRARTAAALARATDAPRTGSGG